MKIRNIRKDNIQKATTEIVKTKQCAVIVLEDLNVQGMTKNHCLAKSVTDASMSLFKTILEYKQKWSGGEVKFVDRFYPSSKTCSACGWICNDLSLSDRIFICNECGLEIDRDYNASINLKQYSFVT